MKKRRGKLRRQGNMIIFPGALEKLLETGYTYVDQSLFDKAVEVFEQADRLEPNHPEMLAPYAIALYETKNFERAKEKAGQLLMSGTADYIDVMELYLTICIQLQEYEEVEETIKILLEEKAIPEDLLHKFNYLKELNNRLYKRYAERVDSEPTAQVFPFTFDEFMLMDSEMQQMQLAQMEGADIKHLLPLLAQIASQKKLDLLVITFALTLLRQAGYEDPVEISKFDSTVIVHPAQLPLPGEDEKTKRVLSELDRLFMKDPSQLEMAVQIVQKYTFLAYPFQWESYTAEEVASAYEQYIHSLFNGEPLPEKPLFQHIRKIDS